MVYNCSINGLPVKATYSEQSLKEIFHPLLEKLEKLHKAKGERILVLLAAPPAAGKSTLLSFLKHYAEEFFPKMKLTTIGMDGFHRYQDYLLTHDTIRDGKTIRMVDVKGSPETFDLPKLTSYLQRVAKGEIIGWPDYNRLLHNPVEDATLVDGDIVLLEGNYLLLEEEGWKDLKKLADFTISIQGKEEMLKERLVERRMATGKTRAESLPFVERSDLYNARLILNHSQKADLSLQLQENGEYTILQNP